MSQMTFADLEYAGKKRKTQKERLLEKLSVTIPWDKLESLVGNYYYVGSQTGRKPYPLESMLKIHVMQVIYNLSDPGMEDHLYDIECMRRFAGLTMDRIPDETTILNFRHLLETHGLGKKLFATINDFLATRGLLLKEGTIMDATLISAPTSTKNKQKARDPEMHSTKKGNQWYFGMKLHIGVDDVHGVIHSIETTSAEVHDIVVADRLLHGEERRGWGDAGYTGIAQREEHAGTDIQWQISLRPGKRREHAKGSWVDVSEKLKAGVRAKVEHSFLYIKKHFGYSKVRYRGLAKNTNRLYVLAGIANLFRTKKYWVA